jgi:hypothetical protein
MLWMACGYRRLLPYLQVAVPVLLLLAAVLAGGAPPVWGGRAY